MSDNGGGGGGGGTLDDIIAAIKQLEAQLQPVLLSIAEARRRYMGSSEATHCSASLISREDTLTNAEILEMRLFPDGSRLGMEAFTRHLLDDYPSLSAFLKVGLSVTILNTRGLFCILQRGNKPVHFSARRRYNACV